MQGNRKDLERGSLEEATARNAGKGLTSPHLTDMKKSRRRCMPEYDLRLSRDFGTSPGFWLRLQLDFELMRAERENGERIASEVQPHAA